MSAPFGDSQRDYYMREINRAMPARGTIPDDPTIQLALGNVDPVMPGRAGAAAPSAAQQFLSYYGAGSAAYAADAACRQISDPLQMRPDPTARTGCGWYFRPNASTPSTAAYGTRRGPMSPTLDAAGQGQWLWDPMEAALMEGTKQTAKITSCAQIQYSPNPNMGWCPSTNSAILTDGMGNPRFPRAPGGDCPGGGIITNAAQCTAPAGGAGGGDICTPNPDGTMTAACLMALAIQAGCSSNGTLYTSIESGWSSTATATLQVVQQGANYGFPAANASPQLWLTSFQQLKQIADTTQGRVGAAASNLVYGTPFNPCGFAPTDTGPFPGDCITSLALTKGYRPAGAILPSVGGMTYWNQNTKTWSDVGSLLDKWMVTANNPQPNPADQRTALMNVYGTQVQYPRTNCNNYGVMAYRYYVPFTNQPVWDGQAYYANNGPQTHFLGRYIYKAGLPSTEATSALPWTASTFKDQTPSSSRLMECVVLECSFVVAETAPHQFQMQVDDGALMYVDDQFSFEATCCGSLQNGPVFNWSAGETHTLRWMFVNVGQPWSFGCHLSVNGQPFAPIPVTQTFLTLDRRLPTIGLEFATMKPGQTITDTQAVLSNWIPTNSAAIGQAYGQTCLTFTNGGGLHSYLRYNQGLSLHAIRSITMSVYVASTTQGSTGTWPSLMSFSNYSQSQPGLPPRQGPPQESADWGTRRDDFSIGCNNGTVTVGIKSAGVGLPFTSSQFASIPMNAWVHLAIVWDDNWGGYAFYINGQLSSHTMLPMQIPVLLFEQICIGSDSTDDGAGWKGGIAWWRGFDYRLSTDQITMDMNNGWANLI
jgi:hypothetical protein